MRSRDDYFAIYTRHVVRLNAYRDNKLGSRAHCSPSSVSMLSSHCTFFTLNADVVAYSWKKQPYTDLL